MKIQIIILSLACLACIIPEAHTIGLLPILAGKALAAKGLALGAGILAAKKAALKIGSAIIAAKTPVLAETEVVVEDTPDLRRPSLVETVEVQPIYGLRTEFLNRYAPAAPIMRYEPVEFVQQVQVPTPKVYVEEVRAVPQFQSLLSGRMATLTNIAANCIKSKITAVGDLLSALCGHRGLVVTETYLKK